MNKYNRLLSIVACRHHINKGEQETENEWKTRLVYSICGMMAYASLWDSSEDMLITITHLKRRIQRIYVNYESMYPEISGYLPCTSKELEDEITNLFLLTGVVYHCPNRVVPSMKHEELFDGVLFQRGIALDSISYVSGVGFYSKQNGTESIDCVKLMFGLGRENLQILWKETLSATAWKAGITFGESTEYLRLKPPFTHGYWVDRPDNTGITSILRTGTKGLYLYYLYRYNGATIEVSPLPQWKVESYNYRTIACACLSAYGTLPPIEYFEDGVLVHVRMNYLLPPRELEFLKLYSWPETCTVLPCNFKRKLSVEVFSAIRAILTDIGYEFKGGKI